MAVKRDLVKPKADARYAKRTGSGRFKESDDVGRSQKSDRRTKAKKTVRSAAAIRATGQGKTLAV